MLAVAHRLLLSILCGMLAVVPAMAAPPTQDEQREVLRYVASYTSGVATKLAPLDRGIANIRFPELVSDAVFASPKTIAAAIATTTDVRSLVAERRILIRDHITELWREMRADGADDPAMTEYVDIYGRNLPVVIELDEARVELIERIDELLTWASQPGAPLKLRDNKVTGKTTADERKYQAMKQKVIAAMRVHDAALVQYQPVRAELAAAEAALKAAASKP